MVNNRLYRRNGVQLFVNLARVRGVIAFQEMVELFEGGPRVLIAFPALAHELVNFSRTQVGFGQEYLKTRTKII